jgi:hypothetical protein
MKNICKIYVLLTSFALFLSGFNFVFAETEVRGDLILEDTTWTKENGPYLIYETPTIEEGVTLRILPGTVVQIAADQNIDVYGNINVGSEGEEAVTFTYFPAEALNWGAINLYEGANAKFDNSKIEYGQTCIDSYGGISI